MKQLTQKLKTGKPEVLEVPQPLLGQGMVLVRNRFSVISTGTEGSTVEAARKSLLGKARERPQQARQALDVLLQQGPIQAWRAVMKKLESYSPLGYSCSGEVIEMGEGVVGFAVNDRVACGGAGYACHAEIVAVPVNLCVKLHADADLQAAAYNTIGAIALQGVRQAQVRVGETVAVIGMGLIGQITGMLLRAGGMRVIGIDLDPRAIERSIGVSTDFAFLANGEGIAERIDSITQGMGCDGVIITAATDSLDPINFAGRIARKRGRVVIVGNVPTGFDRDPYFYRKELEVVMSCSYGPGRYDPQYEEKGVDYPAGFVRWTEKRNMEAFQEFLHSGKIDAKALTTHTFTLDDSPRAYDVILGKKEPYLGMVIAYDCSVPPSPRPPVPPSSYHQALPALPESPCPPVPPSSPSTPAVAFIGAGSYAQSHLLPNLPRGVARRTIMTSSGLSSRSAAERFKFEKCTSDEKEIFADPRVNTVFIATRHDSHTEYVIKGLKSGKHVFVEKPLCLTETELNEISTLYSSLFTCTVPLSPGPSVHLSSHPLVPPRSSLILMVGFNRRFSPLTRQLKEKTGEGPLAMLYRVNAGAVPVDSWIQDPKRGGGRIVGEMCHFLDFMTFINGSNPESVAAEALPDAHGNGDTVSVQVKFANGSIGTLDYFVNNARGLPKEYIEVYGHGIIGVMSDFRKLEIYSGQRRHVKKLFSQDKGQKAMVEAFLRCVEEGKPSPIPFDQIESVTRATFAVVEALRSGARVKVTRKEDGGTR